MVISKKTITYKAVGDIHLEADIYFQGEVEYKPEIPVVLWLHGGGLVGYNRLLLPAHIVQSCAARGWPLVSADYRLLPQVKGKEIVDDAKDIYQWIRNSLFHNLNSSTSSHHAQIIMTNIIVSGASGGGCLALIAAHYLKPPPLSLFIFYASATFHGPFATSSRIHIYGSAEQGTTPLPLSAVSHLLEGEASSGYTPPNNAFDVDMLNAEGNENKDWKQPDYTEEDHARLERMILFPWFLQTNAYPELLGDVDKGFDFEGWKRYPRTVWVHGSADVDAPYEGALEAKEVIGPHPMQLFTAPGEPHAWDTRFFLGDPELEKVEEAWNALDEIVMESDSSGRI